MHEHLSDSVQAMEQPAHGRLGALVRERRVALGLSQQALADLVGVSRESVNRLENATGTWTPRANKVSPILGALGITAEQVADVVDAGELRDALVREMELRKANAELGDFLRRKIGETLGETLRTAGPQPDAPPAARADLVLVSPEGLTLIVEVKGAKAARQLAHKQLTDALSEYGWVVSVVG